MVSDYLFCYRCGEQLRNINEIDIGICNCCKTSLKENNKINNFLCWACTKEILSKKEIAQGICDNCKACIIRKLR